MLTLKETQINACKKPDFKVKIGNSGIVDIDEITSKENTTEAIRTQGKELNPLDKNSIRSIRAAYLRTPKAVGSLHTMDAGTLLDAHKITIGWEVCSISAKQNLEKCFICLECGDLSKSFSNKDDGSQWCATKTVGNACEIIGRKKFSLYQEECIIIIKVVSCNWTTARLHKIFLGKRYTYRCGYTRINYRKAVLKKSWTNWWQKFWVLRWTRDFNTWAIKRNSICSSRRGDTLFKKFSLLCYAQCCSVYETKTPSKRMVGLCNI